MKTSNPLSDPGLERELLGLCLMDGGGISAAAERVQPEDFSVPLLGRLFTHLLQVTADGKPADVSSVAALISGDAEFETAGGENYLLSLAADAPRHGDASHMAELVHTLSIRRKLAHVLEEGSREAQAPLRATEQVLDGIHEKIATLREGVEDSKRATVHVREVTRELGPTLEKVGRGHGAMLGVETGFGSLDRSTAGMCAGEYWLLAARPSEGKSALGLEFAMQLAKRGHSVSIFSLEMSRQSVALRLLCRQAQADMHRLRSGQLSYEGWDRIADALCSLSELPIYIDDRRGVRVSDLRWRIRSLARRTSARLVIVDYLQLLKAPGTNRYEQVTAISIELQAAAGDLGRISGGTLLAIAQLNRLAAGERPQLHHLRDSGQLEQDADTVLMLWTPKKESNGSDGSSPRPGVIVKQLDIAKQRNGPTDEIPFEYAGPYMGFFEP